MDVDELLAFATQNISFLLMWSFNNIPNFHENFLSYIASLGDTVDVELQKTRLGQFFLDKFYDRLTCEPQFFVCHTHDRECKTFGKCLTQDVYLWNNALQRLKNDAVFEFNKQLTDVNFALDHIDSLREAVNQYIVCFSQSHDSDEVSIHLDNLKNSLQAHTDEEIFGHQLVHADFCRPCDYFLCESCVTYLKRQWVDHWFELVENDEEGGEAEAEAEAEVISLNPWNDYFKK